MERVVPAITGLLLLLTTCIAGAQEPFGTTGSRNDIVILESSGADGDCPGTLATNWDGTAEYAYRWQYEGSIPPDYGAWAECYDHRFVCQAHFYFTEVGYWDGQTADIYVWEDDGGKPGNVMCLASDQSPGPIAYWPFVSQHKFTLNCPTNASHFIGFWGRWPGDYSAWFVAADENGLAGCPQTKIAPGLGYPTGWQHPSIVPEFAGCLSLGIGEWYIEEPTLTQEVTWGQIKSMCGD